MFSAHCGQVASLQITFLRTIIHRYMLEFFLYNKQKPCFVVILVVNLRFLLCRKSDTKSLNQQISYFQIHINKFNMIPFFSILILKDLYKLKPWRDTDHYCENQGSIQFPLFITPARYPKSRVQFSFQTTISFEQNILFKMFFFIMNTLIT